ncbi:hypothetical protein T484DRAFT_1757460 [Baffinella frigidus]|nr:hypothetical protein T484DRAFT_1757460 [Cryptophyta sp. CCMP2293]
MPTKGAVKQDKTPPIESVAEAVVEKKTEGENKGGTGKKFAQDWSYLYAPHTLATGSQDDRNGKFLAVNNVAIPCTPQALGDKALPVCLTLLRVQGAGYGVAPYARNMKKGTVTKKLFEMVPATNTQTEQTDVGSKPGMDAMRLYSYEKKSMARGDRCDDISFELVAGDTIVTFVSAQTFENMKMDDADSLTNALPVDIDVIPEMSLLEITISPKSRDACLAGSGVRVVTMRMAPPDLSMYSLMHTDLSNIASSQKQYNDIVAAKKEKFPMLTKDLEENKSAFFMQTTPCTSFINDEKHASGNSDSVQLVLGAGVLDQSDCVDIPFSSLLKYTNTKNTAHACAIIECAAALGALRMFVIYNPYWGRKGASAYRGIPLIDTGVFFSNMTKEKLQEISMGDSTGVIDATTTTTVNTSCIYDNMMIDLEIHMLPQKCINNTEKIPVSDCTIFGPGFASSNAYKFQVNLRSDEANEDSIKGVFVGYFNASSASSSTPGSWGDVAKFKRRRLASMLDP